ncbi:oligosaccharide flippase family protein [Massilia cavernae]|uniref:oligosaccharide flippase family protein n=1 Tax=Massilia cavernae TaxID=2320864 RepID=UPI0015FED363|nr:oligosaccharide flippase family protein [Massilia cavernae]
MSILRKLGANSSIYASTNVLQRGAAFLLMPLYTHYLEPSAYGVLAIVTAVNGILSIVFTLGLTSAITRFYFEYQDDPPMLAQFWGSILVFVLLLSATLAGLLLLTGEVLLRPLIGDVPFWPFVALGVMATFFQPFFSAFLAVLQMRNQAARFAAVSLANFALTTVLTIALLVQMGWGVRAPLIATLVTSAVFFFVSFWLLRDDLQLCLRWSHLKLALGYSLPLVPHSVSSQVTAVVDRLVLNSYLGTAAAGLYSVGAMLALVVEVLAQSVNRAYVPLTMGALKRGQPADIEQIRTAGTVFVGLFCVLGAGVAGYAPELLWLMASAAYAPAAVVVPFLVFAGVANAFYLIFVNVMFYDRSAVRLIPLGTVTSALICLGLSLVLVPAFGLMGAAVAAVLGQTLAAILIAVVAYRYEQVRWSYARQALAFGLSLATALGLSRLDAGSLAANIALKLLGLGCLASVVGMLLWKQPRLFGRALLELLHGRPRAAAAILLDGATPT